MLYNAVRQTGPNLYRVASSFTRPADTTAYTAGDLVANSTTAASVTPLSWTITRTVQGLIKVKRAILRKSNNSITNADFHLHLFNASPTIATNGDNAAFLSIVSGYDKSLGTIWLDATLRYADGAVAVGCPLDSSDTYFPLEMIVAPAAGRIIYGLLSVEAAYTPASGETFTVELEVERA